MTTVFISYRRETAAGEARALFNDLAVRLGKSSVFMDVDSIALGRDFRSVLQKILAACDQMLVIIDKDWVGAKDEAGRTRLGDPSDFVRMEVEAALKRDIVVTPVLVKGAHMPVADQLPPEIRDLVYRNGFELSYTRWESDVREMISRLGLDLPEGRKPTETDRRPIAAGLGPRRARMVGAVALVLLIGWGGYAFFQNVLTIHAVRPREAETPPYWTAWMDQAGYQQEFDKQLKNRWYPNQIEAQLIGGAVNYRGHFEPYPTEDFQFFSRHSLNDDEFSAADAEYLQKGFKRVYQQRIVVDSRPFNQGTWTKP